MSKGFPTGYRRDPSAVVKVNHGSLKNLYQKQILYQKQMDPSYEKGKENLYGCHEIRRERIRADRGAQQARKA